MAKGENNKQDAENDPTVKSSRLWTPYGDPRKEGYKQSEDVQDQKETSGGAEEEMSEEEMRRRIEEAMERITVTDVIVDMMVSLSSLAYQRMGIPKEVNEKYRDMEQARLAIDCLDALLDKISEQASDEIVDSLTGALDNLKLNYAKES